MRASAALDAYLAAAETQLRRKVRAGRRVTFASPVADVRPTAENDARTYGARFDGAPRHEVLQTSVGWAIDPSPVVGLRPSAALGRYEALLTECAESLGISRAVTSSPGIPHGTRRFDMECEFSTGISVLSHCDLAGGSPGWHVEPPAPRTVSGCHGGAAPQDEGTDESDGSANECDTADPIRSRSECSEAVPQRASACVEAGVSAPDGAA